MSVLDGIVVSPSRRPLKFQVTDTSIHFLCFDNAISREERVIFFMSLFSLKPLLLDRSVLPTYKDTAYAPDLYVEVRVIDNVQHPAYGQAGLFARRPIPTNTIITPYSGFIEALQTAVNSRTYTMGYGSNDADGLALDAEFVGNFARFANDPRGVEGGSANIVAESRYTARGEVYTALVTRRPVAAGEEILMSYGKEHRLTEAPWMDVTGVPLMRPRIMAAAPFPLLAAPGGGATAVAAHQLVWQCVQCGFWSLTTPTATVGAAAVEQCGGCSAPRLTQSRLVSVLAAPPLTDATTQPALEEAREATTSPDVASAEEAHRGDADFTSSSSSPSRSHDDDSSEAEKETSAEWWEVERHPIRARTEAAPCDPLVVPPAPVVEAAPPRKRGRPPKRDAPTTATTTDVAVPPKRSHKKKVPLKEEEDAHVIEKSAGTENVDPPRKRTRKKSGEEQQPQEGEIHTSTEQTPPNRTRQVKKGDTTERAAHDPLPQNVPKRRGRPPKKNSTSPPPMTEQPPTATKEQTTLQVEKSAVTQGQPSAMAAVEKEPVSNGEGISQKCVDATMPTAPLMMANHLVPTDNTPVEENKRQRVRLLGRQAVPAEVVPKVGEEEKATPITRGKTKTEGKSESSYEKQMLDNHVRKAVLQKIEQITTASSSICRQVSPTSPRSPANLSTQGLPVTWPMLLPFLCWQVWDPALPLQVATSRYSKFTLSRHVFVYHVNTRVKETKTGAAPLWKKEGTSDEKVGKEEDEGREGGDPQSPRGEDVTATAVKQEEVAEVEEEAHPDDTADEGSVPSSPPGRRPRLRLKTDHMWVPNARRCASAREASVPGVKREETTVVEEVEELCSNSGDGGRAWTADSPEGHFVQRLYLSYQEHNPLLTALAPESSTDLVDRFVPLPATGATPLDLPRVVQEVVLHARQRVYTVKSFKPGELIQYVGGVIRRRRDTRDRPSHSPLSIPLHYLIPRACRCRSHGRTPAAAAEEEGDVPDDALRVDFVRRCRELELVVTNEFLYCPCFAVEDEDVTRASSATAAPSAVEAITTMLRRTCNVTLVLSVDALGSPFVAAVATRPIAAYEPLLAFTQ